MTPIVIHLPGKPVAKQTPRYARVWGRAKVAYKEPKTRAFEKALGEAAKLVMGNRQLLEGPLRFHMVASVPIPKSWPKWKQEKALKGNLYPTAKPDSSNYRKAAEDALNGIVYRDDAQIVLGQDCKVYSVNPSLRIEIEPMSGEEAA